MSFQLCWALDDGQGRRKVRTGFPLWKHGTFSRQDTSTLSDKEAFGNPEGGATPPARSVSKSFSVVRTSASTSTLGQPLSFWLLAICTILDLSSAWKEGRMWRGSSLFASHSVRRLTGRSPGATQLKWPYFYNWTRDSPFGTVRGAVKLAPATVFKRFFCTLS